MHLTSLRSQSSWFYFLILSTNLCPFHFIFWWQLTANVIWICRLLRLKDDGIAMAAFKTFFLFTPDFEMICSNPILAQNHPNSAQVLSWTYCFIFCWLRSSNQLKGPCYYVISCSASIKVKNNCRCRCTNFMTELLLENVKSDILQKKALLMYLPTCNHQINQVETISSL